MEPINEPIPVPKNARRLDDFRKFMVGLSTIQLRQFWALPTVSLPSGREGVKELRL
jgi:hypothetical protein